MDRLCLRLKEMGGRHLSDIGRENPPHVVKSTRVSEAAWATVRLNSEIM